MRCSGLKINEYLLSFAIGAFSLIIGVLIKFIPASIFYRFTIKEAAMTDEEES